MAARRAGSKPEPARDGEPAVHDIGPANRNRPALQLSATRKMVGKLLLRNLVYLSDRAAVSDADELIGRFGEHAQSEAARRAGHSRSLGNVVHYCRWRQIERMIALLAGGRAGATLH
jgi:hypothetical protein